MKGQLPFFLRPTPFARPEQSPKVTDTKAFVSKFQVALLVFAGGKDNYQNCCLLTTIRSMEAAATELGKPMEVESQLHQGRHPSCRRCGQCLAPHRRAPHQ